MGGFFKDNGVTKPISPSKPKTISRNKMTESNKTSTKYKPSLVVRNKREEHTSLAESLREAKVVVSDPDYPLVYAWFGGHMVHIYDDSGKELNVWNTGDFSQDHATEAEIRKSIQDHIKEYKTEYGRIEYDESVE